MARADRRGFTGLCSADRACAQKIFFIGRPWRLVDEFVEEAYLLHQRFSICSTRCDPSLTAER